MGQVDVTADPIVVTESLLGGTPVVIQAGPIEVRDIIGGTTAPYIYVVDSGNNRVNAYRYDDGVFTFAFSFGSFGSGNGQFNGPYAIATDGNFIFITDSGNNRIQKFTMFGVFVSAWGTFGTGDGQFHNPLGIAVDDRYVWMIDSGNNRFQVFTKDGVFVYQRADYEFPEGSGAFVDFNAPTTCSVDSLYFYILDAGNSRVVIYPKTLSFGIAVDAALTALKVEFIMTVNMIDFNAGLPALETELVMTANPVMSFDIELPDIETESKHLLALSMGFDIALLGLTTVMAQEISLSMDFNISLPAIETGLPMLEQETISFDVVLPGVRVETHQVILSVAAFSTVVMTTLNKAVTEYSGWNFNSFAEFGGKQIGFSADGVFELTGETDAGAEINAVFMSGDIDLHAGDEYARRRIRRLYDVHVNRKAAGSITLLLQGEQDNNKTRSLPIQGSGDSLFHTKRCKPGKGLKWRLLRVGIEGKAGSDFDIDQIAVDAAPIGKDA